jgi:hypothetical protein
MLARGFPGWISRPPRKTRLARGLGLVAALATRWGVDVDAVNHGDGKAVWFEVQVPAG